MQAFGRECVIFRFLCSESVGEEAALSLAGSGSGDVAGGGICDLD